MADTFLVIGDLQGGRSGTDVPTSLPSRQCQEAVNIDYYYAKCGNKRWGATNVSIVGYSGQTSIDGSLIRHVPGGDETLAELWTFNADSGSLGKQVQRMVGGSWSAPTVLDPLLRILAPNATAQVRGASLNGKLFLAYKANTTIDRLHVWDGSTVRRVGIAPGAVGPTTAVGGAAAITADTRKYQVAWTKQTAGVTTYRSELTPVSGAQAIAVQTVTVTRPTLPGEGETHWELYAASLTDNYGTEYLIATTAAATTTATDGNNILSGNAAPEVGLNIVPTSWKYLMVHGNRLLGAGAHETGRNNRIWFTAPLGAGDYVGDDERVPDTLFAKNHVDLDENDGGIITGFGGVINGSPIVFKTHSTYRLVATGSAAAPYQTTLTPISRTVGCIRQETVVMAEDETGAPCVYWMSRQGVYRYGNKGLEYCGADVEDIWRDSGFGTLAPPHGVYHADKKQIWWTIGNSIATNQQPNLRVVFHVQQGTSTSSGVRGGWVLHTGQSCFAYASVLFARVSAAGASSLDLVPYISYALGTSPRLYQCDVVGVVTDNTIAYQSYVISPAFALAGMGNKCAGIEPALLFQAYVPTATITSDIGMTILRDFVDETLSDVVTFLAATTVTNPKYKFGKMAVNVSGAAVVQLQYGDVGSKQDATWDYWWAVEAVMLQWLPENRL